ncbi:hypothetical protein M9H77_21547 [Catharanthus roseus]|uniref:Uncharacterized protein n=1 Tax=Catharanthus roseus TaxID=4058 RepID=A0ACC0ANS0_CATRO|nr:hypothetical protein M9H77_21547 [Catharanthus roseus]
MKGNKIEKCHTGTGIPVPYPGPWRVGSGSRILYPGGYGSGSGSKFHYKGTGPGLRFCFSFVYIQKSHIRKGEGKIKKKREELQRETTAARAAMREKEKQPQNDHNLKQQI